MENKTDNNKKEIEQKEIEQKDDLTNFEKIQFMQFEYESQKNRRTGFIEEAELHLAWIGGIFAFGILFTDFKEIFLFLKNNKDINLQVLSIVSLISLVIGLVFLSISAIGFNNTKKISSVSCFETGVILDNGFKVKEILSAYKDVVVDYDKNINELSDKVIDAKMNMQVGVILLLVAELVLKIVVSL